MQKIKGNIIIAYYKDGWHQAKNSTLNFYVENGYVIRGTMGENIDYKPVYPYYYNKKLKCYEKITPKAYYGVLNKITWM